MHTTTATGTVEAATRPARPERRRELADSSPLRDPVQAGLVWALALGAGRVPLLP